MVKDRFVSNIVSYPLEVFLAVVVDATDLINAIDMKD